MKKNFTGGLSSLLGDKSNAEESATAPQPTIEPKGDPESPLKTTQLGTKSGEARATFIVNESLQEKIKAIAYWERLQIKDVVDEAFSSYVASYGKANGAVKPIPNKGK